MFVKTQNKRILDIVFSGSNLEIQTLQASQAWVNPN